MIQKNIFVSSLLLIVSLHAADETVIPFETPRDNAVYIQTWIPPKEISLNYQDPLIGYSWQQLFTEDESGNRPSYIACTEPMSFPFQPDHNLFHPTNYFYCGKQFIEHFFYDNGNLKHAYDPTNQTRINRIHIYALLRTHDPAATRFGYLFNSAELTISPLLQSLLKAFLAKNKVEIQKSLYEVGLTALTPQKEAYFLTALSTQPKERSKEVLQRENYLKCHLSALYLGHNPYDSYAASLADQAKEDAPVAHVLLGQYYEDMGVASLDPNNAYFGCAQREYQDGINHNVPTAHNHLAALPNKINALVNINNIRSLLDIMDFNTKIAHQNQTTFDNAIASFNNTMTQLEDDPIHKKMSDLFTALQPRVELHKSYRALETENEWLKSKNQELVQSQRRTAQQYTLLLNERMLKHTSQILVLNTELASTRKELDATRRALDVAKTRLVNEYPASKTPGPRKRLSASQ